MLRFGGLALAVAAVAGFAHGASAQEQDGRWKAEFVKDLGAVASVNGNVTHGDRFSVAVRGPSCDGGAVFFTAYSHYKNPDFTGLQGKIVKVRLNGAVREAKIVAAKPFLLGHLAFIELGGQSLADIKAQYSGLRAIRAEILGEDGGANRFFDIAENGWSVDGLGLALDAAAKTCKANAVAATDEDGLCTQVVSVAMWAAALKQRDEATYLGMLKRCVAGHQDRQYAANAMSVIFLDSLGELADKLKVSRQDAAVFIRDTVRVSAEAGYAPAQHNYAALYNVDPKGPTADVYPVDMDAFLYWTKKAAARKEPRAMFNLAMRLIPNDRSPLPADPATAYILLRQIQQDVPAGTIAQVFGPVLDEQLAIVRAHLGETQAAAAEARRAGFDFMALEPK